MIKRLAVLASVWFFAVSLLMPLSAHASWNPNNIMNDAVFDNTGSMSATDIQNFLNQFPTSCLKDLSAPYPYNYFDYGGNVSAATVIRRAADLWGINPQVILATLQKESSVVTGTATYGCAYLNTAMGFNCPDSGACPANPADGGFSQQVTKGSWLLKIAKERSLGNVNWDSPLDPDDDRNYYYSGPMTQGWRQRRYDAPMQYFDGLQSIDGQTVSMGTGATTSFYFYTPHFSGNQHLVTIFEGWFGSTQTVIPYAWAFGGQGGYSDSARTDPYTGTITAAPGSTFYVRVKAHNIGNQTWTPSKINIGTSHPNDRTSQFANGSWLNGARPAHLLESSVAPNQDGTFEFSMTAPATTGTYYEYFNVLAEGITWFNDLGQYFQINVVSPTSPSNNTHTGLPSSQVNHVNDYLLSPDSQSTLNLQPDGNLVLYSNFKPTWSSKTASQPADRLAMQPDGNLVLYSKSGPALWNSGTFNHPGAHLELQTDGNLVIYDAAGAGGAALWSTGTVQNPNHLAYVNLDLQPSRKLYAGQMLQTANRKYKVVLQSDGNLVIYSPNRAIWASGTVGSGAAFLVMQPDGNLVLYNNSSKAVWNSGTSGRGLSYLIMQSDGNLVVYNGSGRATWNSNTGGKQ